MTGSNQFARRIVIFISGALLTLSPLSASAAVPELITFEGILRNSSGNLVANGSYGVTFRIYDNAGPGGTVLWAEVTSVSTSGGLFTVLLGSVTPVPDTVFHGPDRWLGIQMTGDAEMIPRQRLTSVGYAYESAQWTSTGQNLFRLSGNLGLGTTTPQSKLHIVSDVSDAPPRLQSSGGSGFAAGLDFYHGANGKGYVGAADSTASIGPGELLLYGSTGTKTSLWAGGVRTVTLGLNGDVGIGTVPDTSFFRLHVREVAANRSSVWGDAVGASAFGVLGSSPSGTGVYGTTQVGYAGGFLGDVFVSGTLSKSAGSFKIDHPLDPANKYLSHSFVESPDMMNIYNGNATLDSKGEAVIDLPDWFGALNKDFRYQLTAIGAPGPNLYIAQEVSGNQFRIAGGSNGMKVSWQVTGIRQDAYANAHRIPAEESKSDKERGFYLHPDLFGQPEERNIEWARHPEMMKEMKDQREKVKAESDK